MEDCANALLSQTDWQQLNWTGSAWDQQCQAVESLV